MSELQELLLPVFIIDFFVILIFVFLISRVRKEPPMARDETKLNTLNKAVIKKSKRAKYKRNVTKRTKKAILNCIERNPSKTAVDVSKESGYSVSRCRAILKELNKSKKVVILNDGGLFRYVLPSDGQEVYKLKLKRNKN